MGMGLGLGLGARPMHSFPRPAAPPTLEPETDLALSRTLVGQKRTATALAVPAYSSERRLEMRRFMAGNTGGAQEVSSWQGRGSSSKFFSDK
jgi:hypothetical protein